MTEEMMNEGLRNEESAEVTETAESTSGTVENVETTESGEAMESMESILEQYGEVEELHRGKIVTGTVVEAVDGGWLVDVGYKCEGFLPAREWSHKVLVEDSEALRSRTRSRCRSSASATAKRPSFSSADGGANLTVAGVNLKIKSPRTKWFRSRA